MKFNTSIFVAAFAASTQAAAIYPTDADTLVLARDTSTKISGIPLDTIFEAEGGLANGTLSTSGSGYAEFLNVLGINATYAAKLGLYEGESTIEVFKTFARLIGADLGLPLGKRDLSSIIQSAAIPLEALNQALSDLLSGKIGSSAEDFAKLLKILGIDAATAAEYGLKAGETVLQYIAKIGEIIAAEVAAGLGKRDLSSIIQSAAIPLEALHQALSDLLSGKIGSSAEDFAKLLKILGIDAATAAEYGLKAGETVLQYIAKIGEIIAAEVAAGLGKRDLSSIIQSAAIPLEALHQALSDLLSGKIGSSAEDFAKLLKILGIDAATAAEYGLKAGETVLQYIAKIGEIIAAEVAAGLGKRDLSSIIQSAAIPLEALHQALSDLLSGKIGSSAEDFAKLLKILGIDAATAAEYGLKAGETVSEYIAKIGEIIAAEVAAGLGKLA
ncbi:unnamed protein product [Candida parapsilosis]